MTSVILEIENACAYKALKASECMFCICCPSQCFCILSADDCRSFSCVFCPVSSCVQLLSLLMFLLHWFVSYQISLCVFVCVYVWVCTGWHRRSTGSRSVSGKEHEPPGNAQKHQHRRHKHKSAKFTFLQIAAARSMNLELSADVYRDAICLPKLQITNFYQSGRYCVISHSML